MSTNVVLGGVGAVVGGIIGGPQGAMWGWTLGSTLGNAIDPPTIRGPSLGDMAQQTTQEGVPIPIVYGMSPPIAGNVMCTSPVRIVKKKSGGKGGPKVETETAFRTYAVQVCEGPIGGFLRVWRNNVKVYDALDEEFNADRDVSIFGTIESRNERFLETARFFLGTYEQDASEDLEAVFGAGTTPAHRGIAYMVIVDEDVTDMRGAIPQWTFQVTTEPSFAPQILAFGRNGSGNTVVCRSQDGGQTWANEAPAELVAGSLWSCAYAPGIGRIVGVFVVGDTGTNRDIYTSDDLGLTWTKNATDHPFAAGATPAKVFWSERAGRFILLALRTSGTQQFIASSVDGESWTLASPTKSSSSGNAIFESTSEIVIISGATGIFRSTDGLSWSSDAFAPSSNNTVQATPWLSTPAYAPQLGGGDGRAVMYVGGSRVNFSEHSGLSPWLYWEDCTGIDTGARPVAYSPSAGKFTTGPAPCWVSVNAIFWESKTGLGSSGTLRVIYIPTGNVLVSVGDPVSGNIIFSSSDGETWAPRHSSTGITVLREVLPISTFPREWQGA